MTCFKNLMTIVRFLILYFQHQKRELVLTDAEHAAAPNKFHTPRKVLLSGTVFILSFADCLHYFLPLGPEKAAGDIFHLPGAVVSTHSNSTKLNVLNVDTLDLRCCK